MIARQKSAATPWKSVECEARLWSTVWTAGSRCLRDANYLWPAINYYNLHKCKNTKYRTFAPPGRMRGFASKIIHHCIALEYLSPSALWTMFWFNQKLFKGQFLAHIFCILHEDSHTKRGDFIHNNKGNGPIALLRSQHGVVLEMVRRGDVVMLSISAWKLSGDPN